MNRDLYLERAAICVKCPEVRENKLVGKTCGDLGKPTKFENSRKPKTCGCILYLKARMPSQSCPQNKW
jgi:hypothetical protein|tara:strand:+ start:4935 stop:5138 length:204 start_codon:yes stop_codon:yes gene_type:complete